jgi:hypothetical protein
MNAIFLCDSVVEPLKGELYEEAMSGLRHLAARNHKKRSGRGAPQEIYACRRHRKEDSVMRDPDVTSLIEYMSSMGSVFMQVTFLSQIRVLQYCSSQVWLWTSFDIHNMCTLPRSCEERTSTHSADDK